MALLPNVLGMYKKLTNYPGGKWLFSMAFSVYAPYFLTIRPYVNDLKPGFGKSLYKILRTTIH